MKKGDHSHQGLQTVVSPKEQSRLQVEVGHFASRVLRIDIFRIVGDLLGLLGLLGRLAFVPALRLVLVARRLAGKRVVLGLLVLRGRLGGALGGVGLSVCQLDAIWKDGKRTR